MVRRSGPLTQLKPRPDHRGDPHPLRASEQQMVVPEAFRHGWIVAHRHRIGHHPLGQVAQIRHCATARSRT
jgi:hypothetical protein